MYRLSKTLQLWPSTEHAKEIDPPLPPSSGLRANHQVYTAAAGERRIKKIYQIEPPFLSTRVDIWTVYPNFWFILFLHPSRNNLKVSETF
jgi:hypothetical protein